jgi:hypothetical protein
MADKPQSPGCSFAASSIFHLLLTDLCRSYFPDAARRTSDAPPDAWAALFLCNPRGCRRFAVTAADRRRERRRKSRP